MRDKSDLPPESSNAVSEQDLARMVDRLPFAVSLFNGEGHSDFASARALRLYDRMSARLEGRALGDVDWGIITPDGQPVDASDLPEEITRTTGEEFDNVELGFPEPGGGRVWIRVSTRRLTDGPPPHRVIAALTDVTAERAALAEVDVVTQMLTQAFDHAPIGIALVATDGRWLRVNQALCDLLGYSESELLATTLGDITHPDDLAADLAMVDDMIAGRRTSYQLNKRYIRSDGRLIWAQLSVAIVTDTSGNPLHFIGQIQDVTERRQLEERLHGLAERDHLTGLLNRRRFEEELDRQLERCARHGEQAALLLLDIDRFKSVNDSGGHAAGDALLQAVADVCERRVRGTDLVARVGGDEFAAILVDSDESGALQVGRALLDSIREMPSQLRPTTASIGLTIMRHGDRPDAVLARADRALYAVKEDGRDGVCLDDARHPLG